MKPLHVETATADAGARHVVPLSGGKDSTALAVHLSQAYPDLAFEYVFSDTGAELPETYEYFDRLEHKPADAVVHANAEDPSFRKTPRYRPSLLVHRDPRR